MWHEKAVPLPGDEQPISDAKWKQLAAMENNVPKVIEIIFICSNLN